MLLLVSGRVNGNRHGKDATGLEAAAERVREGVEEERRALGEREE